MVERPHHFVNNAIANLDKKVNSNINDMKVVVHPSPRWMTWWLLGVIQSFAVQNMGCRVFQLPCNLSLPFSLPLGLWGMWWCNLFKPLPCFFYNDCLAFGLSTGLQNLCSHSFEKECWGIDGPRTSLSVYLLPILFSF